MVEVEEVEEVEEEVEEEEEEEVEEEEVGKREGGLVEGEGDQECLAACARVTHHRAVVARVFWRVFLTQQLCHGSQVVGDVRR